MRITRTSKILLSSFFLALSINQCVDDLEEERFRRSKKGKNHRLKSSRSRKKRDTDLEYLPLID